MNYPVRKIIHVMIDEKFNDMAIRQFESVAPGINEYWVISESLVLTKSSLARVSQKKKLIFHFNRRDVAGVVFHSLPIVHYQMLRHIPVGKCVVWLGWGYDYYSLLGRESEQSLILPKTKDLARNSVVKTIKSKIKNAIYSIRYLHQGSRRILERVDYFSPVLDTDFEVVQRYLRLRAKYIVWNYGTVEDDLSLNSADFSSGENILAGNSASATNNHVELFEAIRAQVDLKDRKVLVPLSYGDFSYREKVITQGRKILGSAFLPLTEFMPKDIYLETIRSCGFVVMNHLRQQAVGNICMSMLMGAKVYLNDRSTLSRWLEARGAVFGSINNLDMRPLPLEKRQQNQRLIHLFWGRVAQDQKTRHLIDVILGHS